MAAERNASLILLSVISAAVLFIILLGVCRLGFLSHHGYSLQTGWKTPAAQPVGECDRMLSHSGFPLTSRRPADSVDDPSGCLDATNPLAQALNVALCFAAASVVAGGIANVIHRRHG
ncbi:MAG TPA: hypothetical protein VHB72_01480 [Candidatus Saccharimonadales bacterium]|nr:hypothetical protein [Candidatus Saccharimonadales bacterium]